MALEVLEESEAERREKVKRLQERVAWLEAVHELQSIRLSRLDQQETHESFNKESARLSASSYRLQVSRSTAAETGGGAAS